MTEVERTRIPKWHIHQVLADCSNKTNNWGWFNSPHTLHPTLGPVEKCCCGLIFIFKKSLIFLPAIRKFHLCILLISSIFFRHTNTFCTISLQNSVNKSRVLLTDFWNLGLQTWQPYLSDIAELKDTTWNRK